MSKTVLPPSASVFLKTVDRSGEKIRQLPVKLNTLWTADECPEVLLPWLAWTLSVDRWDKAWTEETRRDVIRESWMVHRHKGTISAMRRAIAPFGALLSITEWWENGDPPGSFRLNIDVTHAALTEATYQEMERMIALAKPVSRHLKALRLTYIAKGEVFTGAVSHSGDIIQVYPDATLPNPCITGGEIYCAGAIYDSDITRVKPDT